MPTTTDKRTNFERLEPNHPVSLETSRQLEEFESVASAKLIEMIIKLNGFFTPHLVLHEAQLLDHVGMRRFFCRLKKEEQEFDALVSYLTDPGKDPLGLGPVIVASEYDVADLKGIIPLAALLKRKLGVDNPARVPWQFGSINPPQKRESVNKQILASDANHRYELAVENLDYARGDYPRYLELISNVWDHAGDVTRYNLTKPDYPGTLMTLLSESNFGDAESPTAERLREALLKGKLTFNDGKEVTQFD